ncbi:MAG: asparagine synthase (glutamine-hydrolyzing) [Betaproteobacteria bacterium]|nr:asparagine synthase (glutamine-hydrolyzing) [Betaproteobacteria bacterium]
MCGIAGFFARQALPPAAATRMLDALRQRGPDAQHITGWNANFALNATEDTPHHNAMLHARLSIIDPRPISDQPMANDDGSIWICYNGEVYDWAGHAEELRAKGVEFRTRSDTEFVLRAYETWGMDMLPRLRGMFAIVILDLRANKVVLVRDRMGLKPLLYSQIGDDFAYGSTVRSILPWLPAGQRQFDGDAIDAYLAHRYIPAPMTVMKSIRRLENAHYLTFDLAIRKLAKTCYWQPQASTDDWRTTLDAAVSMRTVADRPLGLFLSSGIDSSLVASRLAATGHSGLQTFTAGFAGSNMDESPLAAEIARTLHFPNQVVPIGSRIADDIDRIVADLDEPFADPSCVPTWYLARETTKHVKVVLGGDGGDELFAGYKRIGKHLGKAWRRGLSVGNKLAANPAQSALTGRGFRKWMDEFNLEWSAAYSLRFSGMTPSQRVLLQPDRRPQRGIYWRMPPVGVKSPMQQLLEIDRLNYLPEYILRKGDLSTMAHGLELRAPLLDHHWVNAVTALPDARRFTQPAKLLFDEAMPELRGLKLFERKKKGFNPPLTDWLQDDLRERIDGLGGRLAGVTQGQIEAATTHRLVRLYRDGQPHLAEQVLQLLLLEMSLNQLASIARLP